MSQPPLIVIVGPTASGKSSLAMEVAQEVNGEIICADSRTVYRGMDIGTAKPSQADQDRIPHHLLDIVEPNEPFTAAQFKHLANEAIGDIASRGRLPIMVGGSGLYVDAVIFDYKFGKPSDPRWRGELQQMTISQLQQICRENNIEIPFNSQNIRHLIRAIELGGLPKRQSNLRSNTIVVGISTEKEELQKRVTKRAHAMMNTGVLEEAKGLGEYYGWHNEAMTGNIYRICREVLEGTLTPTEAIEAVIRSDMHLAKRQITWFKRNPYIIWGTVEELKQHIRAFVDVVKR